MTRLGKWRSAAATAALLAIAVPQAASGQVSGSAAARIEPAQIEGLADFVDGVMAQQIASREVAGAVVVAVHRGQVLFARGYGFADIDAGEPVDPLSTLFRPGSVSKLITWAALMQQVESGRVDMDADVNRYLDFTIPPFEGKPIRVRDLFSHSPGMSDVSGITADTLEQLTPYREWMKAHIPQRLWAPGTEISYSNYGAALAGYIVEQVSGEAFADYVERRIFAPLGMASTTFREPLPAALSGRMAKGYVLENGRFVAQPFELYSAIMPAGSGTSSGPDMARFMLAMLNEGSLNGASILKPASVRLLMSDSLANVPGFPAMAHGFFVMREAGPRLVGHGGNTRDFHSNMVLSPETGFGFFVSETGGTGSYAGRTELTNAILGRVFPQQSSTRFTAQDGWQPPVGAYRANRRDYSREPRPEYDVKVAAEGPNGLVVTNQGQVTYWERVGPSTYEQVTGARAGGPYERLSFYRSEGGDWRMSYASQPYFAFRLVPNTDAPSPPQGEKQ